MQQLICQIEIRELKVTTHAPEWSDGWVVELEGGEALEHKRRYPWADLHLDLWSAEVDFRGETARMVHLCLSILLESGQDIHRALEETRAFADSRRAQLLGEVSASAA